MLAYLLKLCYTLLYFRPKLVYFSIMPTGKIFYRDFIFCFFLKLSSAKLVLHLHGKGINNNVQNSVLKKKLYQFIFEKAYVICLSQRLKKDITGIRCRKILILPNGIPDAELSIYNKENNAPVILYLSNLIKAKGIFIFLESLKLLKEKNISFKASIVGGPFDVSIDDVKKICNSSGIEKFVEVKGPKFGKDKEKEFSEASIFVLPSFDECFPLSILEAMRAGVAMIATRVGGIPDMIEEKKEGLLISPNDSNELAQKLELLISQPQVGLELGSNATKKFKSNYTLNQFHKGLADIFDDVLKK
ncbi:MAG: glycosyltransferase family 4 protein [Sphingobacteriales bacterium]